MNGAAESSGLISLQRSSHTHSTVGLNFWPFHGNGNAVQENDDQDDVIKHLVSDDFIAHQTESVQKKRKRKGKETHTSC